MSEQLDFTGERFTPDCPREIWYEHFHRYVFAQALVTGKTVLDAACGEGYGSALLARTAASVVGVDLAAEAILHAKTRYCGFENLDFIVESRALFYRGIGHIFIGFATASAHQARSH